MVNKLTPEHIAELHADLGRIAEMDRTIAVLNRIRSTPASAENFGGAINKALAGMGEPDALPAIELGLAALDGIETSNGFTENGNVWRFWAQEAKKYAAIAKARQVECDAKAQVIAGLARERDEANADAERLADAVSLTVRTDKLREAYHALPNEHSRIGSKRSKKSHARDAWLRAFRKAAKASTEALTAHRARKEGERDDRSGTNEEGAHRASS
ncbi:MAG: hypothetical protein LCH92_08350 [Proteobacteria bacterium]|nr:hypothetical protein [Pseudomonadota bacterium]